MPIYIGADHRGFKTKAKIVAYLCKKGFAVHDLGAHTDQTSCDYPKIAKKVCTQVARAKNNRGILICMSGIGQSIAANKIKGAYAALCYTPRAAKLSRMHNNANVLVLGALFLKKKDINKIIDVWLKTEFEGGRHLRRVNQIKQFECSCC